MPVQRGFIIISRKYPFSRWYIPVTVGSVVIIVTFTVIYVVHLRRTFYRADMEASQELINSLQRYRVLAIYSTLYPYNNSAC